ncbi:tRNA lysidine(34) synthetase TilS [Draconibacterium sp.]|jgi:tRNA(Ile)-lysidine synthase
MLEAFLKNCREKQLFAPDQKVLLAISGGIDSMVLLHLFEKSAFNFGIVHCNFQLREDESDGDEEFVKREVLIHGVPAFFQTFDTKEYAQLNGISIEMAARELRYEYFEKIRQEHNYDFIATAHHSDDLIETFFLNLSRKTGIKGLSGIKEKSGKIIRPILFANREEIEAFAAKNYLEFREDSTNLEVVYQRNFLRHKILPLFTELNPSFKKNVLASIENLKDAETVYSGFFGSEKSKVVLDTGDSLLIDIEILKKSAFPKLLLLEILVDFGFNPTVVDDVFQSLDSDSGKQFFSKSHRLVKDREKLFVSPIEVNGNKIFYIEADDIELFEPLEMNIEKHSGADFKIRKEKNIACIDMEKLQFPLLVRKWQQGDYFQPLGMTGFKKVSDFFIDEKIPLHEKDSTWLLCSGEKIVWIMGQRIDNRFKISSKTKNILQIEINPEN